jgi:hypothetical protein
MLGNRETMLAKPGASCRGGEGIRKNERNRSRSNGVETHYKASHPDESKEEQSH